MYKNVFGFVLESNKETIGQIRDIGRESIIFPSFSLFPATLQKDKDMNGGRTGAKQTSTAV